MSQSGGRSGRLLIVPPAVLVNERNVFNWPHRAKIPSASRLGGPRPERCDERTSFCSAGGPGAVDRG